MTFTEFLRKWASLLTEHPELRPGQAAYAVMVGELNNEALETLVFGDSLLDPFNDDDNLPDFLEAVRRELQK